MQAQLKTNQGKLLVSLEKSETFSDKIADISEKLIEERRQKAELEHVLSIYESQMSSEHDAEVKRY